MDSNVHIDPATFQFPNPPNGSIDKASSLLTHPERHSGSTRLQPRTAGYSYYDYNNQLREFLKARRLDRQMCEELVKGPPSVTQEDKRPPGHRKHSIKTVFRSRSQQKSLKEDRKMPVAIHRTSDGRKYGQILSGQIYNDSGNASTYQVNEIRRPLAPAACEGQPKRDTASLDLVGDVTSIVHQVNGSKQPVNEPSAHSGLGDGKAEHRLSPYRTVESPNPISGRLKNRLITDRPVDGNAAAAAGQNEATLKFSPEKSTTDDSLGLLRDFSQILSRGDTVSLSAAASRVPPPTEAEHQPRVRDFAANGSVPFSRARAAIRNRHRSRSPVKRTGRQTEVPAMPDRSLDAATWEVQSENRSVQSPNNIVLPPMTSKEPARPPLAQPLPMNQEQVPRTRTSPVINCHSKAPSTVSAESTAEEIQSDTSSGVVSNAQSAVFVKVPPQPGPAPLTPLPSLPEGPDSFAPATPRTSQSSRKPASPESSPSKALPQKSPARSQYRLYPSMDSSPPKRLGTPINMNVATELEQVMTQPSPPPRSKRRGFSFPRSDFSPTNMSVGTLDELEQWKKERTENTRQKKLRDLAHMRSHKAMIANVEPATRDTDHEAITGPPDPLGSQASRISDLGASTTLQNRDSGTLSQKLSPIIVVAEQEPTSSNERRPSQKSQSSRNSIQEHPRGLKINGFHPLSPHLFSSTLQGPEDESKARPVSSHSLPVPRPVAHLSPLLQGPSYRSLHNCSTQETSDLEARLSAMERKNAMLERAFLAVLDTSAAFGGSLECNGREGTSGNTSSGVSGRDGNRSSRTSGTESLYAGLENFMALHSGGAGARWSTSSGPRD